MPTRTQGKSESTKAGEYVREEVHHVRKGKHGARSPKQAVAIGLSKARKAGIDIPEKDGKGEKAPRTSRSRSGASPSGSKTQAATSARRSAATTRELKREPTTTASTGAMSRQAKSAARSRPANERSASARKAAVTRGASTGSQTAKKTARTRQKREERMAA